MPYFLSNTKNIALYDCRTEKASFITVPVDENFEYYLKWIFYTPNSLWWLTDDTVEV